MGKFTNPLDGIKVSSPCPADWNEMSGDNRRRYCAQCKLNVYNLSEMTRREAENFIINAEGRVCVKFYRRKDGTVLTKDCPVGWRAAKRKISLSAKAFVSMLAGFLGGVFAFQGLQSARFNAANVVDENSIKANAINASIPAKKVEDYEDVPASKYLDEGDYENVVGGLSSERTPKKVVISKKKRR